MKYATKGYLENLANNRILRFQFNPETFDDTNTVTYAQIKTPGISYPRYQYVGGEVRVITFQLFLDAWEGHATSLHDQINFINNFIPYANQGTQFTPPAQVLFAFGWFVKPCILNSFKTNYTLFDNNLNPLRATVDFNLSVIQ